MKNLFILICLITGTILFLANCQRETSDNVNQDKIWTEYTLYYDANQDITYARAVFKFSNAAGTLLELKSPAEVRFEGEIMTYKPALSYYEKQMTGFVDTGTFQYVDLDHDTFVNMVNIISAISFPWELDTLPVTAAYEMFWIGDTLRKNESVTVFIKGTKQNDLQTFVTNAVNAVSIIFPLNQLQKLGTGNGNMTMHREYKVAVQQGTSAGGNRVGHYKAMDKKVIIGK
ncbi:MAG TPA: hypothetical protein P5050_05695 [Bacteroidia bacterium]|nr:hypothetical protein [Sphingobacteriales bacterium]HPD65142.1 hypothetical protein [Bacteroidia bacterium]HRS58697.1 hypothetical protein [Bacteroidia bacterium]HRU69338.1 hypothetical protein [Bacteroidia bacterium]